MSSPIDPTAHARTRSRRASTGSTTEYIRSAPRDSSRGWPALYARVRRSWKALASVVAVLMLALLVWLSHRSPESAPTLPAERIRAAPAVVGHSFEELQLFAVDRPRFAAVLFADASSDVDAAINALDVSPATVVAVVPRGTNLHTSRARIHAYDENTSSPASAVVAAIAALPPDTPHVLFVDVTLAGVVGPAGPLLRLSASAEYGRALLTGAGIIFPRAPRTADAALCLEAPALRLSTVVHAPARAFVARTSLFREVTHGLRADLPPAIALALALWVRHAVPVFVLPGSTPQAHRAASGACIPPAAAAQANHLAWLFRRTAHQEQTGVALLFNSHAELDAAHSFACRFALAHGAAVYIVDDEHGGDAGTPTHTTPHTLPLAYFTPQNGSTAFHCHLDVTLITPPSHAASATDEVIDELELAPLQLAVYVSDGYRSKDVEDALRWLGAIFGPSHGGVNASPRRNRLSMAAEHAAVAIPLEARDMVHAEWLATLPLPALRHWHTPQIDLSIVTNNRPVSLSRLLDSIQNAHYFGDTVGLYLNLEQTADAVTHALADDLYWPFGTVTVRHRIILGGVIQSITESWYPSSNDSYGVFLEDDIEVSPFFYGWLKYTILRYRYASEDAYEQSLRMYGVSLYQPKNIETRPEGRRPFDAHALFESLALSDITPYLSQIPCSWGAVYFPEIWREFHSYLTLRFSEISLPISDAIVPDIRSNKWPRSWKRYFIELAYFRGYVMLYPNYPDFVSFSTNHQEMGEHIHVASVAAKKKAQFHVPLMLSDDILLLPDGHLPAYDTLPVLDLWGALATDDEVVERGWATLVELETCPVPFRLDVLPTFNAKELLCKREYTNADLVDEQPLPVVMDAFADSLIDSNITDTPPVPDAAHEPAVPARLPGEPTVDAPPPETDADADDDEPAPSSSATEAPIPVLDI